MTIPYSHQSITKREMDNVLKVMKSAWLTQGPSIISFEKKLAQYCGARYAVAVSSGTAALHLSCLAMGLKKGDKVLTTPNSFVATSNSVLYSGAMPDFVDIELNHWNLDIEQVEKKTTSKVKGVIGVHFAGHPYDVEKMAKLARKKKLFLIEDACHALGAQYRVGSKWHRVGCAKHADLVAMSFHPVKNITTGEGGAILTNRKDLYEKLLELRSHGITKQKKRFKDPKEAKGRWYYEMQALGYNYRISDLQCAMGLAQLKRLPDFIRKRRRIAAIYDKAFQKLTGVQTPTEALKAKSAYHLYGLQLELEKLKVARSVIFAELQKRGIGTQVHYIPIPWQPYYRKMGFKKADFPKSRHYYERAISIPLYPGMKKTQIAKVIKTITYVIKRYQK